MTATALRSQRTAARAAGRNPLSIVKSIFFPVAPTYLLMIVPAIILFTFFIIYPAVLGAFWSFTNYVGYGGSKFIGLANYQAAFADPTIRDSYGFTLLFAVVACVLTNVVAMALALALNSRIRWRTGFRTIFFMPMVLSGLIVSYIFTFIIGTSVPIISGAIHFAPLESDLLANQHLAWLGVVFVASWVAVPGAIIIYLAGLVSIPSEVYEAASIDGASGWKQFQTMTFPLLFPFFIINTILTFKGFLNVYDVVVGLTGGGPGTATTSVAQTIFNGFFNGDYAYQMANAVIFFIITLFFAVFQLGVLRRRGGSF
ncbi:MAG: carbohydrate ABC transporter permease [Streptosporangiaceae bacterium]